MQKRRAARLGIAAALAVLAIGAAVPVWTAWYIGELEWTGELTPLWVAISRFPASYRAANGIDQLWQMQEENIVVGAGLLLLAAGVGYGFYRFLTRRGPSDEARDYAESFTGSLPDGRAGGG